MTDRLPHEKGFHVSWDQLHRASRALTWRLDGNAPGNGAVVAVTRGGMAPQDVVMGDGGGILVVDDLFDSGKTLELICELYPKAHFATVYAKPSGRPMVDIFITEVS